MKVLQNPLNDRSKEVIGWIKTLGMQWVQQNHPLLLGNLIYYGYFPNDDAFQKAEEFYKQQKRQRDAQQIRERADTQKTENFGSIGPMPASQMQGKCRLSDLSMLYYGVVGGKTYEVGIFNLQNACNWNPANAQPTFQREDGKTFFSPLSIAEHMLVCVDDFNTLHDVEGKGRTIEDRLRFFNSEYATSTCVVTSAHDEKKFKVVDVYPGFFEDDIIPFVDYDSVQGDEFTIRGLVYSNGLSREMILRSPIWQRLSLNEHLLRDFSSIVYAHLPLKVKNAMGISIVSTVKSTVHVLSVNPISDLCFLMSDSVFMPTKFITAGRGSKAKR